MSPAPPRRARCCPTPCANAAPRSTSSPSTRRSGEDPEPAALERARGADYVTFTSSSTVTNLLDAIGDAFPGDARVVSIGPVTSATAREAGLEVHVEATRHDPDGVVEALLEDAKTTSGL